jgi:hypothetical protein
LAAFAVSQCSAARTHNFKPVWAGNFPHHSSVGPRPVSLFQDDLHFLTVRRYVEANPLRAKRVEKGGLKPLQQSVNRSRPFGDARWVAQTAARLGLGNTLPGPSPSAKPPGKRQGKRETSSDPLSSLILQGNHEGSI